MFYRKVYKLFSISIEGRISQDKQRVSPFLGCGSERGLKILGILDI